MNIDHRRALELARDGDWTAAHRLVQTASDQGSCLIHAYLHRVEGDLGNARYWYGRAGADLPDNALDDEWLRLYRLLGGG